MTRATGQARRFLPTYARVMSMLDSGLSLNDIARRLNDDGTPTSRGGRWYASTVRAMRDSRTMAGDLKPSGSTP